MGMSSGGGKKGSVQSEINVTPLIDVLLVLLIIFMVVMPILMKMETVEVPQRLDVVSSKTLNVSIIVKADLSVMFNDGSTKEDQMIQAADVVRLVEPKLKQMVAQAEPGDAHPKVVFVGFDCGVQ